MSSRNLSTQKLTILALFTTLSLAIFLLESMLPPLVPVPGIKLGLANIITLIVLLNYSPKDAFLVSVARILLASFFAGTFISFLYSLFGTILSLGAMIASNRLLGKKYIFITSIFGAMFHNTGQIIAAILLTSTPYIIAYLPILMISGIITGIFTGLCAHFSNKYLSRHCH
ncbi:MAG: Gx transporter family protein [Thermoflexaceae bacterium]|nr:Gx transporter family protein [Thermoflexaceae bacterium]